MFTYFEALKFVILSLLFPVTVILGIVNFSNSVNSISTRKKFILHFYLNLCICIIGFLGILLTIVNPAVTFFSFGLFPLLSLVFAVFSLFKFNRLIKYIINKKDLL
jgi:hypothetical protein